MKQVSTFQKWLVRIAVTFLGMEFCGGLIGTAAAMAVNVAVGRTVLNANVGGGRGLVLGGVLAVMSLAVMAITEWVRTRTVQPVKDLKRKPGRSETAQGRTLVGVD